MTDQDSSTRILLVEDSLGIAKALSRALGFQHDGAYQVEVCQSAEDALQRLHEAPFNLLISDLRLPGMDGLELLVRAQRIRPKTRRMLITAYGSPEVETKVRQLAGVYLPKPFRLDDIIQLVKRLLKEPPPAQPPSAQQPAERAIGGITVSVEERKTAHLIVVACDLDGTLVETGQVSPQLTPEMWATLQRAKMGGLILILVTGRTLDSIVPEGPYAEIFETIVAENGAVVYFPRRDAVSLPFGQVDPGLLQRLDALGVPLERGMAIAGTWPPHDETVLKAVRESRIGVTVEYNLGGLMVLPAGATKGAGLLYALRELGYSPHNVVACGDGENDRSLFEAAELAAAVANAQPALRAIADVVLSQPHAAGVQALITDLLDGRMPVRRPRVDRQLVLGHRMSGTPVQLEPFVLAESNLGIFGASASGKSWLAGLIAEGLLMQGYQMCIIDPEGDHRGLGASPQTLLLGGPGKPLPAVSDVISFGEWHDVSLVLDLSTYTVSERAAYFAEFLRALRGLRARRGRPHCVLVDETQNFCPREGNELTDLLLEDMAWGGFCIVSFRPSEMAPALLAALDHWLITRLNPAREIDLLRPRLSRYEGGGAALDQLPTLAKGQAFLALGAARGWLPPANEVVKFRVGPRAMPHVRHLRKYLRADLPVPKRFYFCDGEGRYLGRTAANLWEYREAIRDIPADSLQYHLTRGDFERWLMAVLHDDELARQMHKLSKRSLAGEPLRRALLEAVVQRYDQLDTLA
jgi:hydroxymethylpyrimidine pyrophosphatase-like HAD family hydrolase/CheY-like chemotaxis protein